LIVDDSLTIRKSLRMALVKEGIFGTILEADQGAAAIALLQKRKVLGHPEVDLVFVDLVMPVLDGYSFLTAFRQDPSRRSIPVIILTGQESSDKKVRALESGAADYLVKPFDHAELVARVRVQLKIRQLQEELREANRELQAGSSTDRLTGLSNQRSFYKQLEQEVERSRRHGKSVSILAIDPDRLTAINLSGGFGEGDDFLINLAQVLEDCLRRTDLVGRWLGASFMVLLPETERLQAAGVGEKTRAAVEGAGLLPSGKASVSVGVASFPDQQIADADALIHSAEAALAHAKQAGRNRVAAWMGELAGPSVVAIR